MSNLPLIQELLDVAVKKERLDEKSPPGWEGTTKAMKKHKNIKNPWALSWYMKGKGYKSHVKEDQLAEASNDDKNLGELIEKFCEEQKIHRFEGDRGIANLEKVLTALGYKGHSFRYGDPVHAFLSDNSGAVEALLEWINEQDSDEWKENLRSSLRDGNEDLEESVLNEKADREHVGKEHFKKEVPSKIFATGSAGKIARWLKQAHPNLKSALSALGNYINKNEDLSDERRDVLSQAKAILQTSFEKKKESK